MREEFIDISAAQSDMPFKIKLAGISYCDGTYRIYRPKSPVFCIEYIMEGWGTVKTGDGVFYPHKGDTYMLMRGDSHEYYSDADEPWTKIWFNAEGSLTDELVNAYKLRGRTVFHCDTYSYFKRIHKILSDKSIHSDDMQNKCGLVFHEILQCLKRNVSGTANISHDAEILKNYIDSNITSNIGIDELSAQIYKSPAQTIRIFKSAFGTTPYAYHLSNKLDRASLYLENTNMPVREIAYRLGFSDEHYFSGLFRRKTGKRPTDYRRF